MQQKSWKGKEKPATMLHASVSRTPVATSTNLFIPREALTGEPAAVQNTVKAAELIKGMSFYQSCEKAVFILAVFSASSLQPWHNSREAVQSHSNSSAFYCTCVPAPGLFVFVRLVWFMPLSLSEGVFFADAKVKCWIIELWITQHPAILFSHFHPSLEVFVQLKWNRLKMGGKKEDCEKYVKLEWRNKLLNLFLVCFFVCLFYSKSVQNEIHKSAAKIKWWQKHMRGIKKEYGNENWDIISLPQHIIT